MTSSYDKSIETKPKSDASKNMNDEAEEIAKSLRLGKSEEKIISKETKKSKSSKEERIVQSKEESSNKQHTRSNSEAFVMNIQVQNPD
jgi:hypothetical protein